MKFILAIFIVCNPCYWSFCNPSSPDQGITEIYFNPEGGWSIEVAFYESYLDNFRITGLYDTAAFIPGIYVEYVWTVTPQDLQTSFEVNPSGDVLGLEYFDGYYWYTFGYSLCFGEVPYPYFSEVNSPVGEESVAWHVIPWGHGGAYWITVKELPNSIGYDPWYVYKREELSGYVLDLDGNPVPGITLSCFWNINTTLTTNDAGYFYEDEAFCKKYYIFFVTPDHDTIGSHLISVEPDSLNYFEFIMDSTFVNIPDLNPLKGTCSIQNFPNPFSDRTTFNIETHENMTGKKGVIKIYNEAGFIIDIIPIELTTTKQELAYDLSARSLPGGIYSYSLEIGKLKVASGKMVMIQ